MKEEEGRGRVSVRRRRSVRAILGAVVSVVAAPGAADDAVESSPVVVTGTRTEARSFDLPMSIDSIPQADIDRGKLDVNVSEVLNRAPGTFVQNRDNFAQEQQISIRGFGARSQFGTRGIRLLADGIPASSPDGQGSPGIFDLGSAERIEVLRGAFSALYGNHSGGVVQIFTEPGPAQPIMTPSFTFGSYDTQRYGFKFGGQGGPLNYVVNTTYFTTNGYREQSAAEKTQVNGKFVYTLDDRSAFTLVANIFDQPNAEDPLGLTAQQVARNPRQADAAAKLFDTRRTLRNSQVGLIYDNRVTDEDTLRVMGYYGTRSNAQYLAIPLVNQNDIRNSGGVSTFDRDFGGGSLRWTHVQPFFDGPLTLTSGVDYDTASDARQGYRNNLGEIGALKRNEDNTVDNIGAYLQGEWQFLPRWNASAGIRYSEVRFDSRDKFICVIVGTPCSGTTTIVGPGPAQRNPNDSGSATYSAWTPVGGLLYQLTSAVNLYANAGRSFETPTFIELAYRPDGSTGLNFNLQPTLSNQYEIGAKAFVGAGTRVNLALFYIDSSNEIVIARNVGGRAAYQNASGTTRKGAELHGRQRFRRRLQRLSGGHLPQRRIQRRLHHLRGSGAVHSRHRHQRGPRAVGQPRARRAGIQPVRVAHLALRAVRSHHRRGGDLERQRLRERSQQRGRCELCARQLVGGAAAAIRSVDLAPVLARQQHLRQGVRWRGRASVTRTAVTTIRPRPAITWSG